MRHVMSGLVLVCHVTLARLDLDKTWLGGGGVRVWHPFTLPQLLYMG